MATKDTILANLEALGFNSPSEAAIVDEFASALGQVVDNTLTEFDNNQQEILDTINGKNYGTDGYYTGKALAFQYGDDLIVDPKTLDYIYAVIDTNKQIVKQAAFEDLSIGNSSQLFLKIATVDTLGNLIALSPDQLSAFTSYFLVFEIPGLPVSILSAPANIISFNAKCTFYSTYDLSTLKTKLSNALNAFKQGFAFNGVFFDGDLESYIRQTVPGIRDFFISDTLVDGSAFFGSTTLQSGYFNYITSILDNINYQSV